MLNFFNKLALVIKYSDEIEGLLEEQKQKKLDAEREANRYKLDLCEKHQQRSPGTIHSECNCHYCKLEKEASELRGELHEAHVRINCPEYLAKKPLRPY